MYLVRRISCGLPLISKRNKNSMCDFSPLTIFFVTACYLYSYQEQIVSTYLELQMSCLSLLLYYKFYPHSVLQEMTDKLNSILEEREVALTTAISQRDDLQGQLNDCLSANSKMSDQLREIQNDRNNLHRDLADAHKVRFP